MVPNGPNFSDTFVLSSGSTAGVSHGETLRSANRTHRPLSSSNWWGQVGCPKKSRILQRILQINEVTRLCICAQTTFGSQRLWDDASEISKHSVPEARIPRAEANRCIFDLWCQEAPAFWFGRVFCYILFVLLARHWNGFSHTTWCQHIWDSKTKTAWQSGDSK